MRGCKIIYLKQSLFLGYIVLQLFCIYRCATCNVILSMKYVLYVCSYTFRSMFAVPNMAVFSSSLIFAFLVCCSGIVWVIWNGSNRLYYSWYHFSFHIPHALNIYFEVFIIIIIIIIIIICLKGRALVLCTAYLVLFLWINSSHCFIKSSGCLPPYATPDATNNWPE